MKISIITFSDKGYDLGKYINRHLSGSEVERCETGMLKNWTESHFNRNALIFICSCGIAVRAISPFIKSKMTDPAVIVIDETAKYSISLLSGHIGGANELALKLAQIIGAEPVITTATDINGVFSVDSWALNQGLRIDNPEKIKFISTSILAGKTVKLQSLFPVSGQLPDCISICDNGPNILITYRDQENESALKLIAPVITLGIGCKKNISLDAIEQSFEQILKKSGCHPLSVAQVCSIDLKSEEPAILEFCSRHRLPFKTFSSQELALIKGKYNASEFVLQTAGVDNVCERSAVKGGENGEILTGKTSLNGVTMALAISPFAVLFD